MLFQIYASSYLSDYIIVKKILIFVDNTKLILTYYENTASGYVWLDDTQTMSEIGVVIKPEILYHLPTN